MWRRIASLPYLSAWTTATLLNTSLQKPHVFPALWGRRKLLLAYVKANNFIVSHSLEKSHLKRI